jgi:hypothetical protein
VLFADLLGLSDETLGQTCGSMSLIQGLTVLIYLGYHGAELNLEFAKVSHLVQSEGTKLAKLICLR